MLYKCQYRGSALERQEAEHTVPEDGLARWLVKAARLGRLCGVVSDLTLPLFPGEADLLD